jgi:transposase
MPRPGPRTTYRYSDRFKATAVRLSQLRRVNVQDVAECLYIHSFMLSRWRQQAREGTIVTKDVEVNKATAAELKELRKLKRDYERLKRRRTRHARSSSWQREFGFEAPVDISSTYSHCLSYERPSMALVVEISNSFHPVDYGIEVCLYPIEGGGRGDNRDMVCHTLKENQDEAFAFLSGMASELRTILLEAMLANNALHRTPSPFGRLLGAGERGR